jgi:hypothetical protein
MKSSTCIFLLFTFLGVKYNLWGQDFTNIKDQKPVTITGGASAAFSVYDASGMSSRRDPFGYTVGANVDFNIYGIFDIPFSFYYTKKNKTFNQPELMIMGLSPKYKAITLHAGYRSMSFSNYTLSGLTFLGGGIEVAPQQSFIKGKAMYGRLKKMTPVGDTLSGQILQPAYERWAMGAMVTLGKKNTVDLIMFKAWDKKSSLSADTSSSLPTPKENFILGVNMNQRFAQRFSFTAEYALSAYSDNTSAPEIKFETYTYANNLGGLFSPRYSSRFSNALNSSLNFMADAFTLGVAYSRIDPDYVSLGTSYVNSDVEDYQLNISTSFFNNKLNLSGNIGKQHNNLDHSLASENIRNIYGLSLSSNPINSLNLSLVFSNFTANSQPTQTLISDSISYLQVTSNYGFTSNYSFGNEYKQSLTTNINYQTANTFDRQAETLTETHMDMKSFMGAYRVFYKMLDITLNVSYTYNIYAMDSSENITNGPVFTLSRAFFDKKVNAVLSFSSLRNQTAPGGNGNTNILRLNLNYKLGKHHSFAYSNSLLLKTEPSDIENSQGAKRSREFIGSLTYSYSF